MLAPSPCVNHRDLQKFPKGCPGRVWICRPGRHLWQISAFGLERWKPLPRDWLVRAWWRLSIILNPPAPCPGPSYPVLDLLLLPGAARRSMISQVGAFEFILHLF